MNLLFSSQTQFSLAPPHSILAPKWLPYFLGARIATADDDRNMHLLQQNFRALIGF